MDPMIISLIASAILGQAKSQEQQANYKTQQGIQGVKDKVAGLTGRPGQNVSRPSEVDPMFQSLLTGAMVGQQLKKGGDTTTADQPPANVGTPGAQASFASQQGPYGGASDQAMAQRFPWAQNQSQASGY